jgi:hypothetical protein
MENLSRFRVENGVGFGVTMKLCYKRQLRVECILKFGKNLRVLGAKALHDRRRYDNLRDEWFLFYVSLFQQCRKGTLQLDGYGERGLYVAVSRADWACGGQL